MRLYRFVLAGCLPIAAIGIALARGKKEDEAPVPEPAAPEAPAGAPATPAAPTAPGLFADGLPVALSTLPNGLASLSAQGCNGCHYAAHETWKHSKHSDAWTSPTYQAALRSAGNATACVECHLPLAAQHDQLAAGYIDGDLTRPRLQANTSFDFTLRAEGVTCAACHVRGDTVVGTHASPDAPHPVAVSAELGTSELCATCHQLTWPEAEVPFYDTYGEWKSSRWAAAGVTCQACHMAPTAGTLVPGSDGTVPSHGFVADPARAITALVSLPGASVTRGEAVSVGLTVQNTGAGHAFPTGNPFKTATLEVALVDSAGKDLAPTWSTSFGRTVEPAPPWRITADNRLQAGGQWSGSTSVVPSTKGAAGLGAVEVRMKVGEDRRILHRLPVEVK